MVFSAIGVSFSHAAFIKIMLVVKNVLIIYFSLSYLGKVRAVEFLTMSHFSATFVHLDKDQKQRMYSLPSIYQHNGLVKHPWTSEKNLKLYFIQYDSRQTKQH